MLQLRNYKIAGIRRLAFIRLGYAMVPMIAGTIRTN